MICKVSNPAFDRSFTTVSYNGVEVISINQKTAIYDSYVYFHINESAVDDALSKSLTAAEEKAENEKTGNSSSTEEKAEDKKPSLTEFQKKLAHRLLQLEFIVFEDGAQRGYGKMIGTQFPYLQALRKENQNEHDELIDSSERYKKLLSMFPDWTDKNNLQPKYEAKDVGVLAALAGTLGQHGEGVEQCSIM